MNIGNVFFDKAEAQLQKPAITFENQEYTYEHIAILIQKWSTFLKTKVKPGDRVLCLSENCPEVMALYLAVAGLGNVFVPINPELSEEEVADIIERSTPTLAVISNGKMTSNIHSIPEFVNINKFSKDGDLEFPLPRFDELSKETGCLICFTSGSTGRAKGVYASHENEYISCLQYADKWKVTDRDKVLITLPQSFLYGLTTGCLMALYAGAHIYLEKRFHPIKVLQRIEEEGITLFMGVPTMFTMMLDVQTKAKKYDTKSLRLLLTAGAPIADEILAEFKQVFNIQLTNFYALSEIRPIFTHEAGLPITKQQSCGRIVEGVEVKLLDAEGNEITRPDQEGELLARSATLMLGYYGDPELTAKTIRDGWFYTGDLAVFDEEDYCYITGRKKELVIRGGINISPVEVESFIYKHPSVLETVVIGVPDKVFGEELLAQVVLKENQRLNEANLKEFLSDKLASYKLPKYIDFVDTLPKNHTGKISKKKVREQWEQFALQQHS